MLVSSIVSLFDSVDVIIVQTPVKVLHEVAFTPQVSTDVTGHSHQTLPSSLRQGLFKHLYDSLLVVRSLARHRCL